MKRAVLCVLAALLPVGVLAEDTPNQRHLSMLRRYDLDNASQEYCVSIGKPNAETGGVSHETDYKGSKKIKTDGVTTTTTSKDFAARAFANVSANDIIATIDSNGRRQERVVSTKTDDDTITVDQSWDLSAGQEFYFRHVVCDDTGEDIGAFNVTGYQGFLLSVLVTQMVVEEGGGVTIHVQCRQEGCPFADITEPILITEAGSCYDCGLKRIFVPWEPYFECRVGLSISDDDSDDTGTNAEQIEYTFAGVKAQ